MASVSANGAQIKVLQTKRDSSAAVISRVPPASEAEVVLVDRALPKPIISSGFDVACVVEVS